MSAKFPRGGEQTHSQPSVYKFSMISRARWNLMLGTFSCFFVIYWHFSKKKNQKILPGTLSECQSLDPGQDWYSIWVQTVPKVISRRQKLTFFKYFFFKKNSFWNTIRVSKFGSRSGPIFYLGPNCFKSYQQMKKIDASKERVNSLIQ